MVRSVSRLSRVMLFLGPIFACESPTAQTCEPSGGGGAGGAPRAPADQRALSHDAAGKWPNEPTGLTVLSDAAVGAWSESGWRCEGTGLSVTSDAVVFTYQPGFPSGYAPGVAFFGLPTPTPETYLGFWWKPSNPWQSHPSGVNKIALLFPATSAGGTIYIMMFFDGTKYTIQVETTFDTDTRRLEPNLTATPVDLGKWHQVEWYVKYSTSATSRDGVVQWWLDGVPQGAYTDLQMPGDAGFTEYTIRPVWGGGVGDVKKQTDAYSYGRVHISGR